MLLSIITINYNNAKGLKKTMDSVVNQHWRDFEYIIIDGNSTDNSLNTIKLYDYDNLIWVSEPDTGIYNAMNKGIGMAKGKYLLFLNSGDVLFNSNVLINVNTYFQKEYSILSGDIIFNVDTGQYLRPAPKQITFSFLVSKYVAHPSTFIKSSLFKVYGNYDETYKVVSDWAFFLKVLGIHNESYLKIPETISVFDTEGISTQEDNLESVYKERTKVLETYFSRIYNNKNDSFIFSKFQNIDKRTKYLMLIEEYPIARKITTVVLSIITLIIKLFKRSR